MSTPATTSTRGESQNLLLGEITEEQTTNSNLSHSHLNINSSISSVLRTRGESFDSLLWESNNVSTTTTHSHHQDTKAASKISTSGESFDSLLLESTSETNNEAAIPKCPSQPK